MPRRPTPTLDMLASALDHDIWTQAHVLAIDLAGRLEDGRRVRGSHAAVREARLRARARGLPGHLNDQIRAVEVRAAA